MAPQSEKDAVKKVDKHVSPKECFIWFIDGKRGFEPIPGTGCAHYVAHEKGWNSGKPSVNGCNDKYLIRVKDIVKKAGSELKPAEVAVGSIWVSDKEDHCGIVSKVTPAKTGAADANPEIEIEHCSSRQGKVAKNDWTTFFKAAGMFYRG